MRRAVPYIALWLAGAVVGLVAPYTTLAAFTDQTSNAGNTFAAATNFSGQGITPIRDLGTASCGNTSNSLSVPAGGVPVGNTLIARLAHRTTVNGAVNILDTQQNVWSKDADVFQGNVRVVVFSAYITKPLAQNDQITVTFPGVGDAVGLTVEQFSGIASTNRVDVAATASGDSASPSVSVTTTNGNDLLFGAVASTNNRTYTEAAGWATGRHQIIDCGGATRKADSHAGTRIVATTGTFAYAPTLSGSERWAAAVVAYRAASGAASCVRVDPVHITGFEYGPTQTSTGLADAIGTTGGIPTVESAVARSGSYSLKIQKSGGTSYVDKSMPGSSNGVARFALRLASLPTSDVSSLFRMDGAGTTSDLDLEYNAAQNRFEIAFGTAAATPSSVTVEAGRWYVFDFKVNYGATTWTADWRIDGVDQPRATQSGTATTAVGVRYGSDVTTDTYTSHMDDVMLSTTAGDYPIGDGRILALRPDGEGASAGRTNFGSDAGAVMPTNPNLRLDDNPMNSALDWIWQDTVSSTSFIELTFQDATQTCIRGVSAIAAYNAGAGTGANHGKTSIFSGTTERVLYNGDMAAGGASMRHMRAQIAPPTSYWTQSALNGLVARFGYSTDIAPEPRWHAFVLEYATLR